MTYFDDRHCDNYKSLRYTGEELRQNTDRPGSNDHEQYPSRMGNELVWRDGHREQLTPESMR